MTILKKYQILTFLFVGGFALSACSNTPAKDSYQTSEIEIEQENETKQSALQSGESSVQAKLDKAKKEGKAVFIVVTDNSASNTDKAMLIAQNAKTIYGNAIVVKMFRDKPDNAPLVQEWRLSGAPMPLILVISPNGLLTGGQVLEKASAENIASMVPSPKLEELYAAIGEGKHAIVSFTKSNDRKEVVKECKKAVSMLDNKAVFIEVDMNNGAEIAFMNQLRINPQTATSSVTLVINKQGQVAGTAKTIPNAEKLVSAANTPVKSGCGPGCGPAGCGQ